MRELREADLGNAGDEDRLYREVPSRRVGGPVDSQTLGGVRPHGYVGQELVSIMGTASRGWKREGDWVKRMEKIACLKENIS